jgi:hypothetical protein
MTAFWSNPEVVRNARIQLRRGRMLAAAMICFAISLSAAAYYLNSSARPGRSVNDAGSDASNFFDVIFSLQIAVLVIGGGIYCLQSIHREKELNTFDYQRITRTTPLELAIGKLLGAPLLAYFVVLCLMPFAAWAAILAKIPVSYLLQAYLILILGSIAYHALALVVSLLLERGTSAGGIIFFLLLVGFGSIDFGEAVVSPITVHMLSPFYARHLVIPSANRAGTSDYWSGAWWSDSFFGVTVSHFWVLLFLYVTLTAWFLLALARNIKRDPHVYEIFPPLQAFAFVLYLNALLLGFLRWILPHFDYSNSTRSVRTTLVPISPAAAETTFFSISLWFFVILGLALLRNRDRVRRRIRELGPRAAGWVAATWPAAYLLVGATLAGLAIEEMIRFRLHPQEDWSIATGVLEAVFFGLWLARDGLFLQWMNLRRMRRPLLFGALYLIVFYVCVMIVSVPLGWYGKTGAPYAAVFAPYYAFHVTPETWASQGTAWTLALILLALEAVGFAWLQRRDLQWLLQSAPER